MVRREHCGSAPCAGRQAVEVPPQATPRASEVGGLPGILATDLRGPTKTTRRAPNASMQTRAPALRRGRPARASFVVALLRY